MTTSLWFVTPAFQRFALTAVCLEQRKRVIAALAKRGIEAHCVVVADDENLDIARGFGFATVEQRNDRGLGRKFNDGMEYAGRNGADWIVPIGSDSWIDPNYFRNLAPNGRTITSRLYSVVTESRLAELRVGTASGAGPYVFHRSLLEPSGFRPADDELPRGVDGSTIRGIERTAGQRVQWWRREWHPLQYIGFRGTPHLTPYERLVAKWGLRQRHNPWAVLATAYPADLVERARLALSEAVAA